ncbi:hypothetical protein [Bordetella sp. LUAb4]|uniref:hypothetical protein n=1 Tax=Bordetella sp. LUAb4 TaxID=2843195 RepID=UPI001E4AA51B|nr:hypothetical protein [Bordetella sp. LUAb4]
MLKPVVRCGLTALALLLPICASSAPAASRVSSEVPPFDLTCKYDPSAAAKESSGNGIPAAAGAGDAFFDGSLKWDGKNLALSGSMIMNPLDSLVFRNNHGPYMVDHPQAKSLNRREFGAPGGVAVSVGFSAQRPSKAEGKEKTEEFYSVTLQFEKGKLAYMEVTGASFEQGVLIDAGKANSRHCVTTLSPA